MRHSSYLLCNCPVLDNMYNHTLWFKDKSQQLNYFRTKTIKQIDNVQYHVKERSISIGTHVDELQFVNYVVTKNETTDKYYFYFVLDRLYVNDNNSILQLQLDLIQTYLFDIDFSSTTSLINRTHVDRYDEWGNMVIADITSNEGLEVGEYTESKRHLIYDYSNKGSYIVASSDKLSAKNGGNSGGTSGGGVANKMVDANGFILIKCTEAFAPNPYDIGDGTRTVGYGVTEKYQPEYFNQLAPECSEQEASEILLLVCNSFTNSLYNTFQNNGLDMNNINNNEFNAFSSFAYNAGIGGLMEEEIFWDFINGVNKQTIYNKWLTTRIMEGTQFEQGLRDRRKREADAFLNGTYNFKTIAIVDSNAIIVGAVTDNDGKGYIPTILSGENIGENIVNSARKLIDKPYVWGGNYPPLGNDNGTDCSGLCQWAYNDNGKFITRTTYTQINEGVEVTKDNLQLGDLVFSNFSSENVPEHVFLYSGKVGNNLRCIEAQTEGVPILERTFVWDNTMRARRLL